WACSHFEMRFTAAAACKRAGLGDLDSLIRGVNAMALLKHQAKLAFIDEKWLDRALEKSARRKLRRTQRRWTAITVSEIKSHLSAGCPFALQTRGRYAWERSPRPALRYCGIAGQDCVLAFAQSTGPPLPPNPDGDGYAGRVIRRALVVPSV